jgi:hypothetical protein
MTMRYKLVTGLAFSAAFLTAIAAMPTAQAELGSRGAEMVTNGPQINPGDRSARRNLRDSQRYEALVHSNRGFRANRVRKECGPIHDRQLHGGCVASFGRYEGSSLPKGDYRRYR